MEIVYKGQTEEALSVLKAGIAVDPNDKNLYNGLGGMLSVLGRHEEAIAAHQRYVALAPTEPNSYDSHAMTYQWAGDYASAIANYEQALRLNPDFEVAIIHLAHAHFQIGQYQKAIELYGRYIDKAPSDVERGRGYWSIAFVYLQKRDLGKAEKAAKAKMAAINVNLDVGKAINLLFGRIHSVTLTARANYRKLRMLDRYLESN